MFVALLLSRVHKVVLRKRAQEMPNRAIRFQLRKLNRIPAGDKRKLVNRPIGADNLPSGIGHESPDPGEQKTIIKGLRGFQSGMPYRRVDHVQTHEVQVVRCSEAKSPTRFAYSVHFAHRGACVRNMFDRFAGDYDVE